jgi:ABC-type bacteriocin/lantibiotic exporter with double-glycine peptidase domain
MYFLRTWTATKRASFLDPVEHLVNLGAVFQEAATDLARLDEVLRYPVVRVTAP